MPTLASVLPRMFEPRVFYLEDNFTTQDILDLFPQHMINQQTYQTLYDYYRGKHIIFKRTFDGDETKPNNHLVHNYPKIITDTGVSYFVGKPIKYDMENSAYSEKLERISAYNHEDDVNAELSKMVGIFGHAFEILWESKDIDKKTRYKQVSPMEMFVCYDTSIEPEMQVAVLYRRLYLGDKEGYKFIITMYFKDRVEEYTGTTTEHIISANDLELVSTTPHFFGEVPVVEYQNNEERMGDFETILTLVDAYNLVCSDSVNDIQYFNDAYLMLTNLDGTDPETIRDMKNDRVMLVGENGDAKWLVKDINDAHVENIKKRLVEDIHKFSMTPTLSDEKFASNLSGRALSFKLSGLENKTAIKERKFKTGLQKRLRLITERLNLGGENFNYLDIKIIFTRNVPQDLSDLVNAVVSLQGLAPAETLMALLPFIEDPKSAYKKLLSEEKDRAETLFPMGNEPDYDIEEGENEPTNTNNTGEAPKGIDNRVPAKRDNSNTKQTSKASKAKK